MKKKQHLLALLAILLLLFLLSSCAGSAVAEPPVSKITKTFTGSYISISIKEMCETYPAVVRGKIVSVGKAVDPGVDIGTGSLLYGSGIKTEYFIEVSESFKGDAKAGDVISVWVQGGETDTHILTPAEGEMPAVGEEGFFFVTPNNFYYPCGSIHEDGTVSLWSDLVPEWFVGNESVVPYTPVKNFAAEKVAELIRSFTA